MRVNVDSKALKDPRFRRMARELEINWHEALGLCIEVWNYAYEARSELLAGDDIDSIVDRAGVAVAMLGAGLAEVAGDQLRLCGVRKRIGYLVKQAERGRAGGKARAAAQKSKGGGALQANASKGGKRHHSDLDLDQDQAPDQVLVLTPPTPPAKSTSSHAARARGPAGANRVIAFFCERYKTKYGQPPQVLKKHAGALAKIVSRYGEVEGARRTAILFDSPPLFLASTPPDLGTLVQHWDKLVAASGAPSGTARSPIGRAEPASATQHAADAAKGAVPWA